MKKYNEELSFSEIKKIYKNAEVEFYENLFDEKSLAHLLVELEVTKRKLKNFQMAYFECPDCGYKVGSSEFLGYENPEDSFLEEEDDKR